MRLTVYTQRRMDSTHPQECEHVLSVSVDMYVHAARAELQVRGGAKTTDLLAESLNHLSVDIKRVATTAHMTA
jgi:hypothetical protein